jgi:predicted nucleotide-binding protein
MEHYSNVGYAIVLLSPDDEGRRKAQGEPYRDRARQNVILELGYFTGKLGRNRVCALHRGSVEIPTDYLGVMYVPLNEGGGWQLQLAKELKAVGFEIDMNKAI